MNTRHNPTTRREFVKRTVFGATAAALASRVGLIPITARADTTVGRVALTWGNDRADNVFRALQVFKKQIAAAIADRRVVIKPNIVDHRVALACTHADVLEGILEFLKSLGKTDVVIAESSATGGAMAGFDNMGYLRLANKYPVRFIDLNQEPYVRVKVWYRTSDSTPNTTIRVSKLFLDPRNFIISATRFKTHNFAVATLSLKNIAMAAPVVDAGKLWNQPGAKDDKATGMHGADPWNAFVASQIIADNMYRLVKVYGIRPHLAVLDGSQGMQGDGPTGGYAANPALKPAIVGFDWVAADRVAVKLMGGDTWYNTYYTAQPVIDSGTNPGTVDCPMFPAALNYCAQAGLGTWDISQIIDAQTGQPISDTVGANPGLILNYDAHSNVKPPNYSELVGIRPTPRE